MFSGVDDVLCLQIPDDLVRNGSGHRREDSRRWGRFCFSHQLPVEVWVWTRLLSPLQRTLCSRPSGTPKLSGTTIAVALGSSWRSTSTRRCSGPFSLSRSRALTSADESYELQMKPHLFSTICLRWSFCFCEETRFALCHLRCLLSNEASLMIIYLFCFALVYVSYKSPYFHVTQRQTLLCDFQLYYLHFSSLNYNMR